MTDKLLEGGIELAIKPTIQPHTAENISFLPKTASVNIFWKNINYSIKSGHRKKKIKPILKNLHGEVKSGEMTAIMGPSGAGKTSLLNILAGFRFNKMQVEGEILINQELRDLSTFNSLCCYIPQDNNVLTKLTVYETMMIAANLKLPTSFTKACKEAIISNLLNDLNMEECRKTLAGKLSGGQKKRLCIAQELVNNPPVIFLDEPTSGLDSASSNYCINLLKLLSQNGHTVVLSIHQPSARIFESFNTIYMLAEGQCFYDGPIKGLLPFLSSHGLNCPQYHNPADFVTEFAYANHGTEVFKTLLASNASKYETGQLIICTGENSGSKEDVSKIKQNKLKKVSSFGQFGILLYRTFVNIYREPMLTHLRLAAHIVVGVLLGLLYCGIGNDASKILDNASFLFFSLLFLIFTAMMPTVLTFPLEMSIFVREHMNCWYSPISYYMAKTTADLPFQIIFPVVYGSISYWITKQPSDASTFIYFLFFTVLVSLVAQSLGLLIGTLASMQVAVFLAPACTIPILVFSGFFIHLNAIPSYLSWLTYTSYLKYAFEGLLLIIFNRSRGPLECVEAPCLFLESQAFLEFMGMDQALLIVDILVLIGYFLLFRILSFLALLFKVK